MAPNQTSLTDSTSKVNFLEPSKSIKSKMNDRNNNMNEIDDDNQRKVPLTQLPLSAAQSIPTEILNGEISVDSRRHSEEEVMATSNVGESGTLAMKSGQCSLVHRKATIGVTTMSVSTTTTVETKNPFIAANGAATTHNTEDYYEASELVKTSDGQVYKPQIRWLDLTAQLFLHVGALYGLYYLVTGQTYLRTFFWVLLMIYASGFGITAGAHRLWSHKSYKAALPLRILLMLLFTITGQRDAYTWAHDHRIHHKYSETDADPHDARRGFFFAHVGWLFITPHPEVVAKRKAIDMSDLEADGVVMFQKKYYITLFSLLAIALPVLVPVLVWNEDLWISFWVCFNFRFTITLNIAFFVNSVAHMYGRRPYDKNISPVENLPVAIAALGEGWHNYHHVFPYDYKTGELGSYMYNLTTGLIDFMAKIGWASERKSVSPEMVQRRAARCGDGSHFLDHSFAHKDAVWGLGDADITKEDLSELETMKD